MDRGGGLTPLMDDLIEGMGQAIGQAHKPHLA